MFDSELDVVDYNWEEIIMDYYINNRLLRCHQVYVSISTNKCAANLSFKNFLLGQIILSRGYSL